MPVARLCALPEPRPPRACRSPERAEVRHTEASSCRRIGRDGFIDRSNGWPGYLPAGCATDKSTSRQGVLFQPIERGLSFLSLHFPDGILDEFMQCFLRFRVGCKFQDLERAQSAKQDR